MSEIFRGWRRKLGIVTLLLALAFLGIWGRSFRQLQRFSVHTGKFSYHLISSYQGRVLWQRIEPAAQVQWSVQDEENAAALFSEFAESRSEFLLAKLCESDDQINWVWRFGGFDAGGFRHFTSLGELQTRVWYISYWTLITPLTLISAYLLLVKARPPKGPSPTTLFKSGPQ